MAPRDEKTLSLLEVGKNKGSTRQTDDFWRPNLAPLTGKHYWGYVFGMTILIILLLYSTGIPLLICSILQQVGSLPLVPSPLVNGSETVGNEIFWAIMFPLQHSSFNYTFGNHTGSTPTVDMMAHNYLLVAVPFFLGCFVVEQVILFLILPKTHRPRHMPRVNDCISSFSLGILNIMVVRLVFFMWTEVLYQYIHANWGMKIFDDYSNPWNWWLCLIVVDFNYYWWHRLSHYFSWLWTTHVVHHSTEEYNFSTALRQPFLDFATPAFFIEGFIVAFFFPWNMYSVHKTFNLLCQFWLHTQLIPTLPRWELIFNSPSLHRIHHGRNIRALGKNYTAIFIIWDRMFGTFEPEVPQIAKYWSDVVRCDLAIPDVPEEEVQNTVDKVHYGVVPPLRSFNPLWSNIHHFHHMVFVQTKWHSWLAPFVHWTPGGKCPPIGSKMNPVSKYDLKPVKAVWSMYGMVNFVWLTLSSLAFLLLIPSSSTSCTGLCSRVQHLLFANATGDQLPTNYIFQCNSFIGAISFLIFLWGLCAVSSAFQIRRESKTLFMISELIRHAIFMFVLAYVYPNDHLYWIVYGIVFYVLIALIIFDYYFCFHYGEEKPVGGDEQAITSWYQKK